MQEFLELTEIIIIRGSFARFLACENLNIKEFEVTSSDLLTKKLFYSWGYMFNLTNLSLPDLWSLNYWFLGKPEFCFP